MQVSLMLRSASTMSPSRPLPVPARMRMLRNAQAVAVCMRGASKMPQNICLVAVFSPLRQPRLRRVAAPKRCYRSSRSEVCRPEVTVVAVEQMRCGRGQARGARVPFGCAAFSRAVYACCCPSRQRCASRNGGRLQTTRVYGSELRGQHARRVNGSAP